MVQPTCVDGGTTLNCIRCLKLLFSSPSTQTSAGYRLPPSPNAPADYADLQLDMWHQEPEDRPTFTVVVEELRLIIAANTDPDGGMGALLTLMRVCDMTV